MSNTTRQRRRANEKRRLDAAKSQAPLPKETQQARAPERAEHLARINRRADAHRLEREGKIAAGENLDPSSGSRRVRTDPAILPYLISFLYRRK